MHNRQSLTQPVTHKHHSFFLFLISYLSSLISHLSLFLLIILMDQYFEVIGSCPNSLKVINHNKITIIRCGLCNLLNSRHFKLVARARARTPPNIEIIKIKDSLVNSRSVSQRGGFIIKQGIKLTRRRNLITHISSLPNLKLGYVEKDR